MLGDEPFLVISGDALTDLDLKALVADHARTQAAATITLQRVTNPLEFGVVITDENSRITRFLEKPSWGEIFSDTINTGIYVLDPIVLDYMERGKAYDFSRDIFPRLLHEGSSTSRPTTTRSAASCDWRFPARRRGRGSGWARAAASIPQRTSSRRLRWGAT